MPEQPLVSVIMNCFNGEKYLREALDSVLAQTYTNWELIFWDNQSNDKSAEIFKKYNDPRCKYFFTPKHTLLSEARNCAIEYSTGEFLAFLDVDDWWAPEKLEKQIPLFDDQEVGLVYANYWYVLNGKNIKYPLYRKKLPKGWCIDALLRYYCVGLLTILVRRTAFDALNGGFNPKYHVIEDFDFVIKLNKSWKIECVHTPLAFFRFHGENSSIKQKETRIFELQKWCYDMRDDPIIGKQKGLKIMNKLLMYQKAIDDLERRDFKAAWACVKSINFSILQLRLLMKIIVPEVLFHQVNKLLSNQWS